MKLSAINILLVASISAVVAPQAIAQKRGATLEAPIPNLLTVSDFEFNTFIFPAPVKRVFFPAGSPVVGKPVYLAENTQVMLQFSKGHKKPIQMLTELDTGEVVTLRVQPSSVPGISHAVNGARPKAALRKARGDDSDSKPSSGAPRSEDIELLKQLVASGQAPDGFDSIRLPAPTRFDKFSVVPLSGWSDGSKRIFVFSLVAVPGQTAVVSPPQFYRPGINAVMVDGDVVDANNSPKLFMVEEVADE